MILLFDHVISIIIAGVVFLMLITFQGNVSGTTMGRTLLYQGKKHTLELADVLERDLVNAGYSTAPNENGILDHQTANLGGADVTRMFEFWTDVAGTPARVRYELSLQEMVTLDGIEIPLFKLSRSENAGAGWVAAGGSAPTITDFDIGLRTDNNQPTVDLAAVRMLRIRLKNTIAPGIEYRGFLSGMRVLRWGIQIRPHNLRGYSDV